MSLLSAIHVWHFDKVIYLKLSIIIWPVWLHVQFHRKTRWKSSFECSTCQVMGLEKCSPARKANWSMRVRSVRKKTAMFSHMMKFLLTELGRARRENIWLSIRTSWFWVKYFPVQLSRSVNKYIFCFRFCEMILQLQQRIYLAVMKDRIIIKALSGKQNFCEVPSL